MHRHSQRGFTLIELMVAMVVSAIVVLGIFAFSSIQQSTVNVHERNVRVQQALEGAMWSVGQDVRAAGMGWARLCTELRVYSVDRPGLINPGGDSVPNNTFFDPVTQARYWVLRDGIQAHWSGSDSGVLGAGGGPLSSAEPTSAADALDVIVADANYAGSAGVYTMLEEVEAADTYITVVTGTLLDNTNPDHLAAVQQMFPPGSFVIMANVPSAYGFRAENQMQCPLLQVTGDVEADPGSPQQWRIPIANTSGFNFDLDALLIADAEDEGVDDDWNPATVNAAGTSIIPLGRLRWSRYEIDYAVPNLPYLVRYDLIGFIDGVDPTGGIEAYPSCPAGACPMPQLHLPGGANDPRAVAIGPMIEDMQVTVGCDGYTAAGVAIIDPPITVNDPDLTFEEIGPAPPAPPGPNTTVDENTNESTLRHSDEWVGNAQNEQWAPDCVYYGTAEYDADEWAVLEGALVPAFRMSPQAVRVTLLASSEFNEEAGGLANANAQTIEDRPELPSPVGTRQRFTLTEMLSPDNVRWRDPRIDATIP
jgi:prepilin-type N-terminal cleavage/methylation domain-containing protein